MPNSCLFCSMTSRSWDTRLAKIAEKIENGLNDLRLTLNTLITVESTPIYTKYPWPEAQILICFALWVFLRHKVVENQKNQKCAEQSQTDLNYFNDSQKYKVAEIGKIRNAPRDLRSDLEYFNNSKKYPIYPWPKALILGLFHSMASHFEIQSWWEWSGILEMHQITCSWWEWSRILEILNQHLSLRPQFWSISLYNQFFFFFFWRYHAFYNSQWLPCEMT